MANLSIADYYKGFASLSGAITAIVAAVPIVSELTGGLVGATLFPPLSTAYRVPCVIVILVLTLAVYGGQTAAWTQSARARRRSLWITFGIVILGVLAYVSTSTYFVRVVSVPAKDQSEYVSVGYDRTDFAKQNFSQASDWDLLRARGFAEEDIEKLWKMPSIVVARLLLLASYLLVLLPAVAAGSLIVLFELVGPATSP